MDPSYVQNDVAMIIFAVIRSLITWLNQRSSQKKEYIHSSQSLQDTTYFTDTNAWFPAKMLIRVRIQWYCTRSDLFMIGKCSVSHDCPFNKSWSFTRFSYDLKFQALQNAKNTGSLWFLCLLDTPAPTFCGVLFCADSHEKHQKESTRNHIRKNSHWFMMSRKFQFTRNDRRLRFEVWFPLYLFFFSYFTVLIGHVLLLPVKKHGKISDFC